jgi:D-hydroxyproline dehydrogenase subunit alpha
MSTAVRADVAVVGAGPAGMAAALAAADLGCRVILVDASAAMGGQIYRPPAFDGAGAAAHAAAPPMPRRLRRAASHRRLHHLAHTTVWHAETMPGPEGGAQPGSEHPEFLLRLADAAGRAPAGNAGPDLLRARAVVIATGATELALPFPGWDLPGVTTAGAAQALLKGQDVVVGDRVLVAGSGPLLLPTAAALSVSGARVVGVLEATAAGPAAVRAAGLAAFPGKVREAAGYAATLARHRVPVLPGWAVIACHGTHRVQRATIARLTRDWRPVPGSQREVAVDAVHASFGLCPGLELPRLLGCADVPQPGRPAASVWHDDDLATSIPGVFAAGETTGVAGAEVAELEGYIAGAAAARHLGKVTAATFGARTARIRGALARARRFAAVLDGLYPFRAGWTAWPAPDTIACRCEEVPWSAIGEAVAAGARDVRAVKGLSHCGTGYCQGRICGPILQQAVATASGRGLSEVGDLHSRPQLAPTALGTIAVRG